MFTTLTALFASCGLLCDARASSLDPYGFPIIIDGPSYIDIESYRYALKDGTELELADLTDVVAYSRVFEPCDLGPQPDTSLSSMQYDMATTMIDAASARGLKVWVPLPYLANTAFPCDGVLQDDGLFTHDGSIQVPRTKEELTPEFTGYWQDKATAFMHAVVAYDTDGTVVAWRGVEEIRYWNDGEVELGRAMRSLADSVGDGRDLMAYTPNHYLPDQAMVSSLVDTPRPTLSPYLPLTATLSPLAPVARAADDGTVVDFYPQTVEVNAAPTGRIRPMFQHVVTGAYTGLVLGDLGHQNRIHPLHRSQLSVETRDNVEATYAAHHQHAPRHIVFHAPDMSAGGVGDMSVEEARHDFWAGLHVGEGIYLYNFAYRELNPGLWDAYARALHLIKKEMQGVLGSGVRWTPAHVYDGIQTVPADHYLQLSPGFADRHDLALPDGADAHPTLNATMVASDGPGSDLTYLIVTNSWMQTTQFDVDLPSCRGLRSVDVVYGSSSPPNVSRGILKDRFEGIDARVYRIRCVPWSPFDTWHAP